jgi:hypothetical protein
MAPIPEGSAEKERGVMAIHISSLIYIKLPNDDLEDWIKKYLDSKGLSQDCREDIHAILQQAITRQFSHKDAHNYLVPDRKYNCL